MNSIHTFPRSCLRCIILAVLVSSGVATPVWGGDKYWTGGYALPWWDAPLNWSPVGQPQHGDRALLLQSDATNRVVWYYNAAYPSAVLSELRIDASGSGSIELQINAYNHPLSVTDEYIGYWGKGYMYQNTGTNTANFMYLGYNSSGSGTYLLTGSGVISNHATIVGYSGSGTFLHSGGTHANDTLHVGADYGGGGGGAGYYWLGAGTLNAGQLWLGMFAGNAGTFDQTGGVHNARTVTIGGNNGVGTYNLSSGTLNVTDWTGMWIGYGGGGAGTFIQSGGLLHVSAAARILYVGPNIDGPGTYLMSGGTLTIDAGSLSVNTSAGYVDQSGGVANMPELLVNGTYQLSGGGILNVNGNAHVARGDGMGATGTFTQLGGRHGVGGHLYLGEAGVSGTVPADSAWYQLQGGTLAVSGSEWVGQWGTATFLHSGGVNIASDVFIGYGRTSRGTYLLSGTGSLSSSSTFVGYEGIGSFLQQGGGHEAFTLAVAYNPNSTGHYRFEGGSIFAYTIVVADDTDAVGTFTHNGGVGYFTDMILGGFRSSARGTYTMSGGTLSVSGNGLIGPAGSGTFHQLGGAAAFGGTLTIGGGALGAVIKTGGTLSTNRIINQNLFDHSGGTLIVNTSFINSGTATIGGTQRWNSGAMFVNSGYARFDSDAGSAASKPLSVAVNAGQVQFNASQHLAALNVAGGAVARLGVGRDRMINTNALSIAGGAAPSGLLDLNQGKMIVDYSGPTPMATVEAQIRSACVAGWTGMGITSSAADTSSYGLGYLEATDLFGTFPASLWGETIDSTSVLVMFTRYGDANLDGLVNLQDFNRLAANFGAVAAHWGQGDFTYDGLVNLQDFNRLAANFGLSASPEGPTPDDWAALAAAVPEPAGAGVAVLALLLALRRPRGGGALL